MIDIDDPLLRHAAETMGHALQCGPSDYAELEARAQSDGSILGEATWSRAQGWAFHSDMLARQRLRGGGYVSLRVIKSW